MKHFLKSFYLNKITFAILGVCIGLFSFGLLNEVFFLLGKILFFILWIFVIVEIFALYSKQNPVRIERKLPVRLSNGDTNFVSLKITNSYSFDLITTLIEDLPEQFQFRQWEKTTPTVANAITEFRYSVEPKVRGVYLWQNCYVLFKIFPFSLVSRREIFEFYQGVACFPSFEQFNKIPVKAIVSNFYESSQNSIRKIGQSLEFEQIKEYSSEDDYRHINWKASAKRGQLMLNQYQDERSQDIYCILDLGRSMKMPFLKQTLLDYSINASLALSKAVITMQDKAGILGLSHNRCEFLSAKKDFKQFGKINDMLYNLQTEFLEANYELLYKFARVNIKQRSLLVIFTNFDSVNSLHRQMPYLKALAKYHLLLVVFFENSEVANMVKEQATDLKDIYTKTIGQSILSQNKLIVKELHKFGIQSLLIQPQKLSLEVINKFVLIKKKQLI
jgi:uncharacterized protein (DUF58 family)